MRKLLVTAFILATSATALAQPTEAPTAPTKSPDKALALSAAGTAAGIGMMVGGLALNPTERPEAGWGVFLTGVAVTTAGPSLGHAYAGDPWTAGLAIRGGGAVAFATGTVIMLRNFKANDNCRDSSPSTCDFTGAMVGGGVAGVGLLAIGAGAALDIATAPGAAKRWNERHGVTMSVTPTLVSGREGTTTGIGVVGTF